MLGLHRRRWLDICICMLRGSTHYCVIAPRVLSHHIVDFPGSHRMETAPTSIEVLYVQHPSNLGPGPALLNCSDRANTDELTDELLHITLHFLRKYNLLCKYGQYKRNTNIIAMYITCIWNSLIASKLMRTSGAITHLRFSPHAIRFTWWGPRSPKCDVQVLLKYLLFTHLIC